ncbi:MAG: serine/threonine protein kinase [Lentisphaerae bacterium]|nr:MAG: serine/threonine protein kinase [Lentisphaerota bacterium]
MALYCPECRYRIDVPQSEKVTMVTCPGCSYQFRIPDEYRKDVLRPGTRVGGYEIVRLIGTGGMGKVYEAIQLSLNRRVALKVLSPKVTGSDIMRKRFLLEVRATASLEHVNIVTVYEANQYKNVLFLAMELIDGISVDKILSETKRPLDEKEALQYAKKVAQAMEYAWRRQKLLHRDIKPANILIDSRGEVKLCDLGIAKRPNDEFDITQEGMAIGTPHYMSPEQGQGLIDIDFRADIYSLGASLFHMVTGRVPFDDQNAVTVITKHIVEDRPDPRSINPDVSEPCAKLILTMMQRKREKRHPSWEALIRDIDLVLDGQFPEFDPEKEAAASDTGQHRTAERLKVPGSTHKRTLVDMESIQQEQRRLSVRQKAQKGWRIVLIACVIFAIFAVINVTVWMFRKQIFRHLSPPPELPVILEPDDGTSPYPEHLKTDREAKKKSP